MRSTTQAVTGPKRENIQSKSNGPGRGGARKGAGRKPGSATKRTREIADRAAAEGITPLEYMLALMRADATHEDPAVQARREAMKLEAAKAAAPYIHPRLQAIEHSGSGDPLEHLTDDELDAQFAAALARLGLRAVAAESETEGEAGRLGRVPTKAKFAANT